MIEKYFDIPQNLLDADAAVMRQVQERFAAVDSIKEQNQWKMLRAFMQCGIAANHLSGSSGYGYDDAGRMRLEEVFAKVTGSEEALVRHHFMSGTHAIAVALFGLLRPGQHMLCASGIPYDTLHGVIGIGKGDVSGSLADFGIGYRQLELCEDGGMDIPQIKHHAKDAAMLYLQRSRGYALRKTLSLADIQSASQAAKEVNPDIVVLVDNCYGEFVCAQEPTSYGADIIVGSMIKNPGGGIAPTGGYIAGRAKYVNMCAQRLSAPGVGAEVGCTPGEVMRQMYLGLYFAPEITAQAIKSAVYASALFEQLGYEVSPRYCEERSDIITAIKMCTAEKLQALCVAVQHHSPVDAHLTPVPWPMPGYDCDVIMASGSFTLGSSIELSCDAPLREPYTAFLQGGLNFAASRAALLCAAAGL